MRAADLGCLGDAARGAAAIEAAFPSVVFTSGRRSLASQAHAMAENVYLAIGRARWVADGEAWLRATYRASKALDALCADLRTRRADAPLAEIASGFARVLTALPPAEAMAISRHLSGYAWDVRPVDGAAGEEIKAAIRALPGLDLFLTSEGGLRRWHAQFRPRPSSEDSARPPR